MIAVANLFNAIVQLILLEMFIWAVMSWLIQFNVLNPRNGAVRTIWNTLERINRPLLAPLRRIVPSLGGVDITPVIFLLLLYFVRDLVNQYLFGPLI